MLLSDFTFLIEKIQAGAVCVLPTDTIYGLIAAIDQPEVVERVYDIKKRDANKPFIVLISDITQLQGFSITLNEQQAKTLNELWPGPVSIILPCPDDTVTYLHRGSGSIAFRIPKLVWLRELISQTGPLIATSANKSGMPVSDDIAEIMRQLPQIDFHVEGPVSNAASRLGRLHEDGSVEWLSRR